MWVLFFEGVQRDVVFLVLVLFLFFFVCVVHVLLGNESEASGHVSLPQTDNVSFSLLNYCPISFSLLSSPMGTLCLIK